MYACEMVFPIKIEVYVSDVTENAPVSFFSLYKTFHSFEMYSVGERTPQRNYFLFPSVERSLRFNEKKQIFSQTITSLNLNGKVCNTVLKTRQNCATCVKLGEEFQSVSSNNRFNNS